MSRLALNGRALLAAVLWGVFAARLAGLVVRPTARLGPRVRPYALASRIRLGRGADPAALQGGRPAAGGVVGRLFGPPVAALAARLGALIDARSDEALARSLRQSGLAGVTPEEYRMRQLGAATLGVVAGAGTGIALTRSPWLPVLLAFLGFVAGAARWRGAIDRAIRERRVRIRSELYTINQLLAIHIKTGGGPLQAVRRVVERGRGAVVDELAEGLRLVAGGLSPAEAFQRLAAASAEYHAARTYELLAAGAERGADLGKSLLEFSEDIRDARREDLKRSATRRRAAMLVPTILILAPVMLLFVMAPIPYIIFGR